MKSLVMFVVEHGETTDPLTEFIDKADLAIDGAVVRDYTFRVDLPACFELKEL